MCVFVGFFWGEGGGGGGRGVTGTGGHRSDEGSMSVAHPKSCSFQHHPILARLNNH